MGQNALWRSSFVIRCRQRAEAIAGISERKNLLDTHGGKKPRNRAETEKSLGMVLR